MTEKGTIGDRPRQLVARFFVCTAVVMFILAAVEGVCYLWLLSFSPRKAQSPVPPSVVEGESWAPQYARESPDAELTRYRPYVIWRRAPFSGKTINVDSEGIRKTSYTSCGAGDRTVWMFGDSALWGAGSPDWKTIPSHLARLYSESGHGLCVKNFGEKGWVSTQETIQLMLALKRTTSRPNLVIFYDGVADSMVPYPSNVPDSHTNFDAMKTIVEGGPSEHRAGFAYLKHSNTYHVLGMLQRRFSGSGTPSEKELSSPSLAGMSAGTTDNYQKNIDIVEALSQHYGMRCLFVWQPVLLVGNKPRSQEEQAIVRTAESELHPGTRQLIQATYQRAKAISRSDFLYLGDVFSDEARTMFVDFRHASPEGNRVIAERIFKFVEEGDVKSP